MLCLSVDAAISVTIYVPFGSIYHNPVGWVAVFVVCLVPEPIGHYHYFEVGLQSSSFKGC